MIRPTALPDPDHDPAFYDGVPAKRFFAWLVDVAIISTISLILGLLTLTVLLWVWPILYMVVSFLYRAGTIGAGSATWGMRLMNLELRNALGQKFTGGEAVAHTGLYLFWSVSVILQLVSIGLIAGSRRHQGLHDHILGSAAINRPR
jgi:uncharacterized RDD family membrane protein YckC